jgi:hypothetical protein
VIAGLFGGFEGLGTDWMVLVGWKVKEKGIWPSVREKGCGDRGEGVIFAD